MKKLLLALALTLLGSAAVQADDKVAITWEHVTQQENGNAIPSDDIGYLVVYNRTDKEAGWWGLLCWEDQKAITNNWCDFEVPVGVCFEAIVIARQPSTGLSSKPSARVEWCGKGPSVPAVPGNVNVWDKEDV